jgi:hypothetical protein
VATSFVRDLIVATALVMSALAIGAEAHASSTIRVGNDAQLAAAVRALRQSGGTIVLRPRLYRRLVVGPRSGRPLRILGTPGTRVGNVVLQRTRNVSLGRVRVAPVGGDAIVDVRASRGVLLHDLVVSARGTRFASFVRIPDSRDVTIRKSDFSHCGDRSPEFANCVLMWRWSRNVTIEDNRFHDCRGCDFVHGRFGSYLTIRRNRFDRALPCRMSRHRCGHQDLVQLFAGRHLLVERNRFGVYRNGGAQLYLTNNVDRATVVNNVFAATDPRVRGYRVRMGIIVGSSASTRLPHYARIVNNTILSGARRRDGYAGSIRMSSRYGSVLRRKRPLVANNVLALLKRRTHICSSAKRFTHNIVISGTGCTVFDGTGPADLDAHGRPRAGSVVIDGGARSYAPRTDATGRRRTGLPDIGAFEYRRA